MKVISLFCFLLFLRICSFAQPNPPYADSIIKFACVEAAKENKKVFLIFHASWCIWCHRLDSSLNDFHIRSFFDRNFVIAHLTILESGVQTINENCGALDLYRKYGGIENTSIPFWIVLDKNGRLLANSKSKNGTNIGCPATIEEVQHFVEILKHTSNISAEEQKQVELVFRKNDQ